jgi:large subunit ribosomal protein L4
LVIDDLSLAAPRTKDMAAILKYLDCPTGQKLLVTTAKSDANVYRSARNIEGVSVSPATDLNALSILSSRKMLVTKAALDDLVAAAKKHNRAAEAATEA